MSKLRVFLFLLFAAAVPNAASAAGDVYFEFPSASADGAAAVPQRVDIQSWSWGATNSSAMSAGSGAGAGKVSVDNNNGGMSAGGKAAGKVSVQDLSVTKQVRAAAPADGSPFVARFSFDPESAMAADRFGRTCSCPAGQRTCPGGKHFDTVVIVVGGKRYRLDGVTVDCVADNKSAAREIRGHVTLMK